MPLYRAGAELLYFAHVPKCAGLSMDRHLSGRFGRPALSDMAYLDPPAPSRWSRTSPQHIPVDQLRRLLPMDFVGASFAFVRNPARRIISAFFYQQNTERTIPPEATLEEWIAGLPGLLDSDPWAYDGHFAPMTSFVPDEATVFRLEDGFDPFHDWIDARYGAGPRDMPMLNRGSGTERTEDLSDRARALLEDLFADDYQRFGYPCRTPRTAATPSGNRADILHALGVGRLGRGQFHDARTLFERALAADPHHANTLSATAVIETIAGNFPQAIKSATSALEQDRTLADAHMALIQAHLRTGEIEAADAAISVARRVLGELPGLDLQTAMLAGRRGEQDLSLSLAAAVIGQAAAGGASVLRDEAQTLWGEFFHAAKADGSTLDDLCTALGLEPARPGPVAGEPARDALVIGLGADCGIPGAMHIAAGHTLDAQLRAVLGAAHGRDVVVCRAGDRIEATAILQLVQERAKSGWAALGTAWLDEPRLGDAPAAPEALRAAIRSVFRDEHAPTPLPMLFGGAVVLSAEAVAAALARCDAAFKEVDEVIPALTLAVADAGLPVASWVGAIAHPAEPGQAIVSNPALARLCAQEGDLRVILALHLAQTALADRRLAVALAAAALPDRQHLLAAMTRRPCADLPTALRHSAFAALWRDDSATAISALTALERGDRQADLVPFVLPTSDRPVISIIIPAHNQIGATYCALSALRLDANAPPYEVILVDDGSTDATGTIETVIGGLRVLRHATARRFIAACNAGAAQARGDYLCFLNNDTEPMPGWLDTLLQACRNGAGLAGARLILPDGTLQEAGGLLDNLARPSNHGRGAHPLDPRYSYRREADYLSGAALMVSRGVWDKVDGFSTYLEGMYYEDTDLACKVRAIGLPVRYIPAALVVHHEGTTSGRDVTAGPKALQEVNAPRFQSRWAGLLRQNPPPGTAPDLAADHRARGRILFVDMSIPRPDTDAGGHASFEEMRMMCAAGWKVTFIDAAASYLPGYVEALQDLGVEVLHRPFVASPLDAVRARGATTDILYVSRHWLAQDLIPALRKVNPAARIIINVADLHYLRNMREARVLGDLTALQQARIARRQELATLEKADMVLSYSAAETAILWEATEGRITARLCPWADDVSDTVAPLHPRSGLSFLGGFAHAPNLQGVSWFIDAVLPLLPKAMLDVYGSGAGDDLLALASPQVRIRGFAPDVSVCFDRHRIFVSPLLAGAGVKGKVIKALCHGIPCVLSPIAAEGLGLVHGVHAFIAETPADWAAAIDLLSRDDARWHQMSEAALDHARRHYGRAAAARTMATLLDTVTKGAADPATTPKPPSTLGLPGLAARGPLTPRFALRFEVQHHGSAESAIWLAEQLAHPRHSLHLNLDADHAALTAATARLTPLQGQFGQLGLTQSAQLRWCGPSVFLALLDRLRHALAAPGWDYLINLSGTCAPLQPLDLLDQHLARAHDLGKQAHCFAFPIHDGPLLPLLAREGPVVRGKAGRLVLRGPAGLLDWIRDPGRNPLTNTQNRLFVHVSEPEGERHLLDVRPLTPEEFQLRRRILSRIEPNFGRAWYALHRSVVEALVRFLDAPQSEDLRAALLPTLVPDEHMIQTILANGLIMDVARLERTNLHRDQGGPRTYSDADLTQVLNTQGGYFLRKIHDSEALGLRRALAHRVRRDHALQTPA